MQCRGSIHRGAAPEVGRRASVLASAHAQRCRPSGSRGDGEAPPSAVSEPVSRRQQLLALGAAALTIAAPVRANARADDGLLGAAPLASSSAPPPAANQRSLLQTLCATPYGVNIVGVTEFVALLGALVGGLTARQRKQELERLNEQLRKINLGLRQQARAGTVYTPGLSYAPTLGSSSKGDGINVPPPPPPTRGPVAWAAQPAAATAVATATAVAPASAIVSVVSTEEEEMSLEQLQCRDTMRQGKRLLKEGNGAAALVRFEKALMLCKGTRDKVQERRAMRGLAAAARMQGQHRSAIKHLERVLEISMEMREFTGDADAYGTIADCYADLGELDRAAAFYDKYIERLTGPVARL